MSNSIFKNISTNYDGACIATSFSSHGSFVVYRICSINTNCGTGWGAFSYINIDQLDYFHESSISVLYGGLTALHMEGYDISIIHSNLSYSMVKDESAYRIALSNSKPSHVNYSSFANNSAERFIFDHLNEIHFVDHCEIIKNNGILFALVNLDIKKS